MAASWNSWFPDVEVTRLVSIQCEALTSEEAGNSLNVLALGVIALFLDICGQSQVWCPLHRVG